MNEILIHYKKQSQLMIYFIVFSVLVAIDFWSFIYLPAIKSYTSTFIVVVCMCLIVGTKRQYKKDFISVIVTWTIITCFTGIIPAAIDYNQSFIESISACVRLLYPLFIYFILKKYSVNDLVLLKIISFVSFVWVMLELFQQITYPPYVWFSGRYLAYEGNIEQRLGMWRFYIWGVDFVMIAFSYWLYSIKENKNKTTIINILMTIIFTIGLLCYGSRKHIYVTLIICFLFLIKGFGQKKWLLVILFFLSSYFLYENFYTEWLELNEKAANVQGEGEDFIRFIAAKYFIFDFSDSPLYPIFGAGLHAGNSKLSNIIENLTQIGYYQADVGIIGYYSKFGLLGVSAIIMYIVYFIKNWKFIDEWLKYFFIMKVILIVFDFWAIWDVGMMAYAIFLYILGCNIQKNKLKKRFITK